jgi:TonB-dependent siderophore receptor
VTIHRKHSATLLALSILTALLLAGPTWAETDDEEEADPNGDGAYSDNYAEYIYVQSTSVPQSNTIATKLPTPTQLTPANIGAVSEELIREQDSFVLTDALANVSGLNIQSGSGVHDFFVIRGYDSLNGGLVLTDGASEPEVTYYPLYNVEGVEVLKGPAGFLYGSNPLAGVVNLVRKQPVPNDLLDVSGSFGSHGHIEGSFDWNEANEAGNRNFRINGFWRESDGYRDDTDSEHFAVNPSFTWQLGGSLAINVNLEYVEAEYSPDSGLPLFNGEIADVPRTRSYQSPYDESDQTLYRVQVDVEKRFENGMTLRNKTYYRDLDWESNGTVFNGVFPNFFTGAPEVSRTLTLLDDRQQYTGNQTELILRAETGAVQHDVLFGLEAARLTDDFTLEAALLPSVDLFNPMETATGPISSFPAAAAGEFPSGDAKTTVVAPYVVDQMKFNDHVQLFVGARFDSIDFEDDENDNDRDDSKVSPLAGVVFSIDPSLSLYVNAAESFAPPSPRAQGNPDPEESDQIEIGLKKKFLGGKLQTNFAAFRLDRDNIAIPDDNGVTQQTGDQRSEGVELELAAEPLPGFRTFFAYAYTDAELTEFTERVIVGFDPFFQPIFATLDRSGNTPAFVPEHLASVWLSKRFKNGFGVGGGARHFSDQYIAEDNAFEIDGATVLDATAFYDVGDWRLRLNLKNVTDEEYETRGFGSTSVIPAPKFTVYAGFEYRM